MRIVICEDDEKMQLQLQDLIVDWAKSKNTNVNIKCFPSGESFIVGWPDNYFDLAFFDIEMDALTGIELAKYIRKSDENMMIAFVTSHAQYAIMGYEVNASHYLKKPLSPANLLPVLNKAYSIWLSTRDTSIVVTSDDKQLRLAYSDIFAVSKIGHIANVKTASGELYETRKTLDEFEECLPEYFVRCHRSYIINLHKVDCVYKTSVLLSNGDTFPVSRNNAKNVSDAFIRLHMG